MIRFLLILATFLFPWGIWLGLEGYEIPALLCLIFGWAAMGFLAERSN